MKEMPNIITGGSFTDARGTLYFVNDFDLLPVRRFYIIDHPDTSVVRAWQAHKTEQKWFYVLTGSFKIVIVKPEEWISAPERPVPQEYVLRNGDNRLLHVPGGFANGFQALEPHSKLIVFSNYAIADAGTDDHRFDKNLWYNW